MPSETKKISAVWVYWEGGADGDELRYSMRSVHRHFTDAQNLVICGDGPDWFTGPLINSPRFNKQDAKRRFGSGRFAKWCDSVVKLRKICESPLVTDQFLWLYDDTFFLRDLTVADLSIPRCTGFLCKNTRRKAKSKWREVLRRTAVALQDAGRPTRNFSHHGPMVFDKAKMLHTINQFDAFNHPRVIESLYGNQHYDQNQMRLNRGFVQYNRRPWPGWCPRPDASIVNVGSFNVHAAAAIMPRFPHPIPHEQDPPTPAPTTIPATEMIPCDITKLPPAFGQTQ